MITVKLNGGLGNQMFQYALGRALSLAKDVPLNFDGSFFKQKYAKNRPFSLRIFNSRVNFSDDLRIPMYWSLRRFFKSKNFFGLEIYHEKDFAYDENIFSVSENAFIEGFFQSEKYFKKFEYQIRKDFTFEPEPDEQNSALIEEMSGCASVSVHVRRGDYINKARYQSMFSHCDINYYTNAANLIAAKIKSPVFYFFSDEPDWIKENFKLNHPFKIISHNIGAKSYEDMRLMSFCKHNIIANSSFSWWGAWLNNNSDKIIICPKKWFAQIPTPDIYPENWKKI